MARRIGIAASICALALSSPAVAADAPQAQGPTWGVDMSPGLCSLNRRINDAPAVFLSVRTTPGIGTYELVVSANPGSPVSMTPFPATIEFQKADSQLKHDAVRLDVGKDRGKALLVGGMGAEFLDAFAHSSAIGVSAAPDAVGPYPIPSAEKAIAAFRKCESDQLVVWGADPAQFKPGGKMAVALEPRDSWITAQDRTRIVTRTRARIASAGFSLKIAPDGTVDGCSRYDTENDKPDELTKVVCKAFTTQKLFTPAADASGNPVRGAASYVFVPPPALPARR